MTPDDLRQEAERIRADGTKTWSKQMATTFEMCARFLEDARGRDMEFAFGGVDMLRRQTNRVFGTDAVIKFSVEVPDQIGIVSGTKTLLLTPDWESAFAALLRLPDFSGGK